ncbi:hypothetical protein BC828DRAFT_436576 [Blastocladiella britannica]|nr:hypothetical protein BC828DRAFT_436576 [Blastocladiella britannica]
MNRITMIPSRTSAMMMRLAATARFSTFHKTMAMSSRICDTAKHIPSRGQELNDMFDALQGSFPYNLHELAPKKKDAVILAGTAEHLDLFSAADLGLIQWASVFAADSRDRRFLGTSSKLALGSGNDHPQLHARGYHTEPSLPVAARDVIDGSSSLQDMIASRIGSKAHAARLLQLAPQYHRSLSQIMQGPSPCSESTIETILESMMATAGVHVKRQPTLYSDVFGGSGRGRADLLLTATPDQVAASESPLVLALAELKAKSADHAASVLTSFRYITSNTILSMLSTTLAAPQSGSAAPYFAVMCGSGASYDMLVMNCKHFGALKALVETGTLPPTRIPVMSMMAPPGVTGAKVLAARAPLPATLQAISYVQLLGCIGQSPEQWSGVPSTQVAESIRDRLRG